MNKEMYGLCEWVIKSVKQAGADDCKARIKKNRFVEIDYHKKKPEKISEASKRTLDISVYVNGRYSSRNTSDLRREALKQFIDDLIATAKLLEEDPYRSLPNPKYYEGRIEKDLKLFDESYDQLSAEDRHDFVKRIEAACINQGGDKVITVNAGVYDELAEEVVMTSNGFEGSCKKTECWAGADMTARDEGDRQPRAYHWVGSRKWLDLPPAEEIGQIAANRTLDLIGSKKIKTEKLPIIIENQNVELILNGFVKMLYGKGLHQKRSCLADKIGKKVGTHLFTLVDDPFVEGGFGSRLYDSDGFAANKKSIVENGVLNGFYIDWYSSRKLDREPTTGNPSNLIVPPGKRSVKEIMKDLGRGIYINEFIGGNSNSLTGDFSIGITGTLFENGKPVQAVAEMNIADNHLEFWNKLIDVANDPWIYHSWRMPSLVFKDVVVSGT